MQFEEHLHNISHDFNWNSASHAHSVIAELLVYIYAMVCIHVSQKTSVAFNLCCCIETEWWGACAVICLEWGADLCMAQLIPRPLTLSCFSKIQIGFTFLVPTHLGSPGKKAVCVCVHAFVRICYIETERFFQVTGSHLFENGNLSQNLVWFE